MSYRTKEPVECEIRQALLLDWKQITGVEPASPAWEAGVLPMNYICGKQALSRKAFTCCFN